MDDDDVKKFRDEAMATFIKFEDDLERLLLQHFPNEPVAIRALALAVALGDLIGARSTVSISIAVDLVTKSVREAAEAQRKLVMEMASRIVPSTETRQ